MRSAYRKLNAQGAVLFDATSERLSTDAFAAPNSGFEAAGVGEYPEAWTLSWSNSCGGSVRRSSGPGWDAAESESLLRWETGVVSAQLRFAFDADGDTVYFSVVQLDESGDEMRVDEAIVRSGESRWSWIPRQVAFETTAATAAIRIRFGLSTSSASVVDIDALR